MEYKGDIEGFPKEVVERMLDCQEEQENKRDVSVFEDCKYNCDDEGGFDWSKTKEGNYFWEKIIANQDFDIFFEKYLKQTTYYYKGKPYKIVCESKIKIENKWVDVVIYECLYDNPDGKIWVREKEEFYRNFKKVL